MKFLYLLPFLLPQVASACGLTDSTMTDPQLWLELFIIFIIVLSISVAIAGVIYSVLLVPVKLLPTNRNSSWRILAKKFKKLFMVLTVVIFILVGFTVYHLLTSAMCLSSEDITPLISKEFVPASDYNY